MATIIDLLDAAAKQTGSDYRTAKALGVTPQRVSDWRHGRQNAQPEDHALVALLAKLNPEEALVRAVLEKHKDTAKGERLLSALGKGFRATGAGVISLIFASVGFLGPSREAQGSMRPAHDNV